MLFRLFVAKNTMFDLTIMELSRRRSPDSFAYTPHRGP